MSREATRRDNPFSSCNASYFAKLHPGSCHVDSAGSSSQNSEVYSQKINNGKRTMKTLNMHCESFSCYWMPLQLPGDQWNKAFTSGLSNCLTKNTMIGFIYTYRYLLHISTENLYIIVVSEQLKLCYLYHKTKKEVVGFFHLSPTDITW